LPRDGFVPRSPLWRASAWRWTRNAPWRRSSPRAAGATIVEAIDPCVLPKAVKNPVEQAGHRAAQARDGASVTRFLHWLSG
jgi:Xaa-Pro aminopeptidase